MNGGDLKLRLKRRLIVITADILKVWLNTGFLESVKHGYIQTKQQYIADIFMCFNESFIKRSRLPGIYSELFITATKKLLTSEDPKKEFDNLSLQELLIIKSSGELYTLVCDFVNQQEDVTLDLHFFNSVEEDTYSIRKELANKMKEFYPGNIEGECFEDQCIWSQHATNSREYLETIVEFLETP